MIACRECSEEFKYYAQRTRHEAKNHGTVGGASTPPTNDPNTQDTIDLDDTSGVFARFSPLPPKPETSTEHEEQEQDDSTAPPVDTDAIRQAFTVDMLADLLKGLSATISDWDGAGALGTFSPMEAKQIAYLVYDPIVNTIATKFGGNVGRFKMTVAIAIIVLGKGRIHFNAIRAKRSKPKPEPETVEHDNSAPTSTPTPTSTEREEPQYADDEEPEFEQPVDFKALAQLQKGDTQDD
jgi:hypothetical protein